jgi:hypothetical protein
MYDFLEVNSAFVQGVPLATEPGISLIIVTPMKILQRNLNSSTDTFLFISHTTNILLFKFRCNIFIGVRIIKEVPGSVANGTSCRFCALLCHEIHHLWLFVSRRKLLIQGAMNAGVFIMGVNEITFAHAPCKCMIFWK